MNFLIFFRETGNPLNKRIANNANNVDVGASDQ